MDLRELPMSPFLRHPWEMARATFFRDVLRDHGAFARPIRVLDVGAGDAYFAGTLQGVLPASSEIVCFDPGYDETKNTQATPGIVFCRQPPDRVFDLLVLLDVIEHVPDDRGFLADLVARNLAPGGLALVSVPAWMALYTGHDVALGHHRRYRPADVKQVVQTCGLAIEEVGSLFTSLLLPRAAQKLAERIRGRRARPDSDNLPTVAHTDAGGWRAGPALTALVGAALSLDGRLGRALGRRHIPLPGLSAWALGRKI